MSYTPEVGEVCEFQYQRDIKLQWVKCRVDYLGTHFVVFNCDGNEHANSKEGIKFRKIKTERERFIEKGEQVLSDMYSNTFLTQGEIILALYNSGKFKLVESDNE